LLSNLRAYWFLLAQELFWDSVCLSSYSFDNSNSMGKKTGGHFDFNGKNIVLCDHSRQIERQKGKQRGEE
jgi:hypothetical protein